eukprot:TRINITY_DN5115_c0_g2_i1.p1 TRINITY_DN5115_c0_g2~~TRINITY_DN5115_c0_g2_i1.p1  ORF type:complete len:680 (-),score=93.35 TRINITY_DN5115_c0_g2_i1:262-2142(-)
MDPDDTVLGGGGSTFRSRQHRQNMIGWPAARVFTWRIVTSWWFNTIVGLLVLANMVLVVLDTNYRADDGDVPDWINSSSTLLLVFFTLEVISRVYALRERFLGYWNVLDLFVIVSDWVFEILSFYFDNFRPLTILRVLRILRALRVLRAVRSMTIFRELYVMLHGFFATIKAVFWASLLLVLILSWWAIIAVEVVHPLNKILDNEGAYGSCERCGRAFANVQNSILTFIQQLIAGDSWGMVSIPIMERFPSTTPIFMMILISVNIGLLNLILSVIVDSAAEVHETDTGFQAEQRGERMELAKLELLTLCKDIDDDSSGQITLEELLQGYDNVPEFKDTMDRMDVNKDEMQALFTLLDSDCSGSISYIEFTEKIIKMKMTDGAMALIFLKSQMKEVEGRLGKDILKIYTELSRLEHLLRELIATSGSATAGQKDSCSSSKENADGARSSGKVAEVKQQTQQHQHQQQQPQVSAESERVPESKWVLTADLEQKNERNEEYESLVSSHMSTKLIVNELNCHRERVDEQFRCLLRLLEASTLSSGDSSQLRRTPSNLAERGPCGIPAFSTNQAARGAGMVTGSYGTLAPSMSVTRVDDRSSLPKSTWSDGILRQECCTIGGRAQPENVHK